MWLINTSTYSLEFILEPRYYAILSHTWEDEEVTFQDIKDLDLARTKAGWNKIEHTCRLAQSWNLEYAWVDTCCIDKSSSAELSEAINSMFEWYKKSTVCFVYLSDLDISPHDPTSEEAEHILDRDLPKCRWLTRGWTLQELIAPYHVDFYDQNWTRVGTKTAMVMQTLLAKITRVDINVLVDPDTLSTVAVGRRMSWAAHRQTTRVEDMAYCLLGIFDVNLPMIYGEGSKAFIRLQEAIAAATDDLSLFAWSHEGTSEAIVQPFHGVLASSSSQFSACDRLENIDNLFSLTHPQAFTLANRNVLFTTYLEPDFDNGDYLMPLNCRNREEPCPVALRLLKTTKGYIRHWTHRVHYHDGEVNIFLGGTYRTTSGPSQVTIPKRLSGNAEFAKLRHQYRDSFLIDLDNPACEWTGGAVYRCRMDAADVYDSGDAYHSTRLLQATAWDMSRQSFFTAGHPQFTGLVKLKFYISDLTLEPPYIADWVLILVGLTKDKDIPGAPTRPWVGLTGRPDWTAAGGEGMETEDMRDVIASLASNDLPDHQYLYQIGMVARDMLSDRVTLPQRLVRSPWRPDGSAPSLTISAHIEPATTSIGDAYHKVCVKFEAME